MSRRTDDKFDHNFNQNHFVHNHKRQYHKHDVHTYRKFSISMTSNKGYQRFFVSFVISK